MLSARFALKRPSAADTIFPPKKRALYEHMKLHGIDKFPTNQIAGKDLLDNFGTYEIKIPVNIEIAQSENFSRPRSDSLHSQLSSNSDNTETASVESRETSPCTIQSLFDHHTPERNPITSLDGLKPDISKPLFPPSDSDTSPVGSDGHLSPDNSLVGEQVDTRSEKYGREAILLTVDQQTDFNSIPKSSAETFHESEARKNHSFQKENIPNMEGEEQKEGVKSFQVEQKQSDVYMGPMVSLLNRFNAEAVQNSVALKIKEQFLVDKMRNFIPPNSSVSRNVYPQRQLESSLQMQNNARTLSAHNETQFVNKVSSEKRCCHLCNKEFTSRANLHNHMKTHENKCIQCWVCKENFQTAEGLNTHMKIEHKGENPYKCEHCSREFSQFNNLRRHLRVHREKVFKCNLCNREFNEEFYLKMHMGTHTGKRVYSCGVCSAGFPSSHDLKMHVKTHSPSLLHTCDVCGKSFSKACVLRQHKKGHSGERPHKCDKCDKTFIHRHHLTMHMKSHVDEKRLSCDICKKEFSQHSHLYKHLRAHEEMKRFGVDLEAVQKAKNVRKRNADKREVSQGDEVGVKPIPKVVLNLDKNTLKERDFENSDKQVIRNGMQTTRETLQHQRCEISQNHFQHSQPVSKVLSSSTDKNKSLPSMLQTFGNQSSRYPSIPYGQGIPHNYLHGSPGQPFSRLYNPMLRNGVPAPLHGYQSYNQMYRNYSEQMQTYYNNVYMMNFLSQNALLQKHQGEGQNFQKRQSYQPESQNEIRKQPSIHENPSLLQPKVVKGVEGLEKEQVCYEKDENSSKESRTEDMGSENEANSDLDVVNERDDLEIEGSQSVAKELETNSKESNEISEEHEIAQELLKMSAGTKMVDSGTDRKCSKLANQDVVPEKSINVNRKNFTHCINDIIERTIRNESKSQENYQSNTEQISSSFNTVARSDAPLLVTASESIEQHYPVNFPSNSHVEYCPVWQDAGRKMDLRLTDVNRLNECQTSPLQKLKLFVTSEEEDFNKAQLELDDIKKHDSASHSHGHRTDNIDRELRIDEEENYNLKVSDGECLNTVENGDIPMNAVDNDLNEVECETNSLEMRLEKIRQFADIGKRFGKSVSENGIVQNEDNKNTSELTEGEKDNLDEIENQSVENIDKPVVYINSTDNAGYFDDSLEDRQLEIVENVSAREELEDHRQLQENGEESVEIEEKFIVENTEETDDKLNNSTGEQFVFTENEFLNHISKLNDVNMEDDEENIKIAVETEENGIENVTEKSQKVNEYIDIELRTRDEVQMIQVYDGNSKTEPREKSSDGNDAENEAIDLRTVFKSDESKDSKVSYCESVEQENLPMDLSLSGKKHDFSKGVENMGSNVRYRSGKFEAESPALLTCGLCWKTYSDVQELEAHQIEHAKNIGNHCSICKRSFTSAFELQCHMLKHRNLKTSNHNNVIRINANSVYEIDEKPKASLSRQKVHVKEQNLQVIGRESLECSQSEMNQINEPAEKQYCCQYCDKMFDQADEWQKHKNTHKTNDKPYVCNVCNRAFSHRHNLNRHKMSHNLKTYECSVCNRSFKELFYLQMHMKTHEEENVHKCQICGQNVRKSEIWQHTSQHLGNISENPTYQQIGNRVREILHEQNLNTYDDKARLDAMNKQTNSHNTTGSGDMKSVELGEGNTRDEEALNLKNENIENWNVQADSKLDMYNAHKNFQLKVNTTNCVSVLTERKLEESNRNSVNKSFFECHICKSVLKTKHELENHMGIHSGLRPHVCNTCGRAFKKSKGLRTHEKLHLEPSLQV